MSIYTGKDLEELKSVLYSSVISDAMDALGCPGRTMRPFVRPLSEDDVIFGVARTGRFEARFGVDEGENPYEIEIELIDDLRPNDIPTFACSGPTDVVTPWGELLTSAAMQRGATGFVTDGLVRDVRAIRKIGFPVFHGGIGVLDSRGRSKMVERDKPVVVAGAPIATGDLIFGDIDGVVSIPKEIAQKVIDVALEKVNGENVTREEIARGALLGDVYSKYGIL